MSVIFTKQENAKLIQLFPGSLLNRFTAALRDAICTCDLFKSTVTNIVNAMFASDAFQAKIEEMVKNSINRIFSGNSIQEVVEIYIKENVEERIEKIVKKKTEKAVEVSLGSDFFKVGIEKIIAEKMKIQLDGIADTIEASVGKVASDLNHQISTETENIREDLKAELLAQIAKINPKPKVDSQIVSSTISGLSQIGSALINANAAKKVANINNPTSETETTVEPETIVKPETIIEPETTVEPEPIKVVDPEVEKAEEYARRRALALKVGKDKNRQVTEAEIDDISKWEKNITEESIAFFFDRNDTTNQLAQMCFAAGLNRARKTIWRLAWIVVKKLATIEQVFEELKVENGDPEEIIERYRNGIANNINDVGDYLDSLTKAKIEATLAVDPILYTKLLDPDNYDANIDKWFEQITKAQNDNLAMEEVIEEALEIVRGINPTIENGGILPEKVKNVTPPDDFLDSILLNSDKEKGENTEENEQEFKNINDLFKAIDALGLPGTEEESQENVPEGPPTEAEVREYTLADLDQKILKKMYKRALTREGALKTIGQLLDANFEELLAKVSHKINSKELKEAKDAVEAYVLATISPEPTKQ
ncbi:MAG: hypothetical protein WCP93_01005 [Candidatus Berkelbacteria bacterium]